MQRMSTSANSYFLVSTMSSTIRLGLRAELSWRQCSPSTEKHFRYFMISVFVGTFSLATWLLVSSQDTDGSDARADTGTNTVGDQDAEIITGRLRDIVASTSHMIE